VQVLKGKYPQSDSEHAIALGNAMTGTAKKQIFRFNPGKQEKIFPPKHPYYKAPEQVNKTLAKIAEKSQNKLLYKELIGNTIQTETSQYNSAGIIRLNSYGLKNFLDINHSATYESKLVLKTILNEKTSIGNPEFEPLNMERKNINKKIDKGWTGVNKYVINAFGKKWQIKTAIIHNNYEVPYCIKRIS
jgi:hypothetical protein